MMKRWQTVALGVGCALVALVVVAVLLCQVLGIRSKADLVAYQEMSREQFPPVWKDLALRRFGLGSDIERLVTRHAPLHHDEAPPYARVVYVEGGRYPGLTVIAKDGRLIAAAAGAATWGHVFFDAAEQQQGFEEAQEAFLDQWRLEADAYRIHQAITCGQHVFLAHRIERRMVPDPSPGAREMIEELEKYLGPAGPPMRLEVRIGVGEVLWGGLEAGTTLTFEDSQYMPTDRGEGEVVLLHFEDRRMLYPDAKAEALCLSVPRRALDWYESLSADQVEELARRCAGKLSKWIPR